MVSSLDLIESIKLIEGIGLSSNVYVIEDGNEYVLIDTGLGDYANNLPLALQKVGCSPKRVKAVILTHTHFDHVGGLSSLFQYTSPEVYVHPLEKYIGPNVIEVEDGYEKFGLKILHTPGHTLGSLCLYMESIKALFSGDTVFPNGMFGRTDLGGDSRQLIKSLERLAKLDAEYLLPGHEKPVLKNARDHIRQSYEIAREFLTRF